MDMNWQDGQNVDWQEGHRVTPDLSGGLCGEGSADMHHASPSPAAPL